MIHETRVQREAELGDRERRRDKDARLAPDRDGLERPTLASLGSCGSQAADGGRGELRQRWLALGKAVVEQHQLGAALDDAGLLEECEHADADHT